MVRSAATLIHRDVTSHEPNNAHTCNSSAALFDDTNVNSCLARWRAATAAEIEFRRIARRSAAQPVTLILSISISYLLFRLLVTLHTWIQVTAIGEHRSTLVCHARCRWNFFRSGPRNIDIFVPVLLQPVSRELLDPCGRSHQELNTAVPRPHGGRQLSWN